jgi:hypothetical protein
MEQTEFVKASELENDNNKKRKIDTDFEINGFTQKIDIYTLTITIAFGDNEIKKLFRSELKDNGLVIKINEIKMYTIDFFSVAEIIAQQSNPQLICKIRTNCNDPEIVGSQISLFIESIEKKANEKSLNYKTVTVSLSKDIFSMIVKKND